MKSLQILSSSSEMKLFYKLYSLKTILVYIYVCIQVYLLSIILQYLCTYVSTTHKCKPALLNANLIIERSSNQLTFCQRFIDVEVAECRVTTHCTNWSRCVVGTQRTAYGGQTVRGRYAAFRQVTIVDCTRASLKSILSHAQLQINSHCNIHKGRGSDYTGMHVHFNNCIYDYRSA